MAGDGKTLIHFSLNHMPPPTHVQTHTHTHTHERERERERERMSFFQRLAEWEK